MKKPLTVICAALILSVPLVGLAQPGPPDRHDGSRSHQGNPPHAQSHQQGRHDNGHGPAYRDPNFRPQHGMPIPHKQWHRGHAVDPHYRGDRYWVTDWKARHLYAPPRDHRWLYVNGDYVLVAIASGVIVNILTGY